MSVSLDGFIQGPNRDLGWQLVDDELHTHFNEELSAMSAFLDGTPMFQPSDTRIPLQLVETRLFSNGVFLLRYPLR